MATTQSQADPTPASVKGTCDFRWGPGCTGAASPDGNHLCQLAKGHTKLQCECYYDGIKQVNASRDRV